MRPNSLNSNLNGSGNTIGSARRGGVSEPHGRRTCRAPVRSTSDRVVAAWHHARRLERHSLVAACLTSVALVVSLRAAAVVAGTTAIVGVLLAAAALVDAHERRLPNRLLALALACTLGGAVLSFESAVVLDALLGMVVGGGLLLTVRLSRGVGMGDVKMAAVVGSSVGASTSSVFAPATSIAIAAVAGATYGMMANRKRVPLGPSLWFGWAATLALVVLVDAVGGVL